MLLKVVIPNGQVKFLEWEGIPKNPLGYRVLFKTNRGSGLTGIVVGFGEGKSDGRVYTFPDKLPLIQPYHLEVAKELSTHYLEFYGKILWDFIPSVFDWYMEEMVSLATEKPIGLDRKSKELWEYVRLRKEIPYERLKERFGTELVRLLIERNILKRYEKWIYPKVEEEIYSLSIPYEEALRKARSKRQRELIELFRERKFITKEELKDIGFNLRTIKSLVVLGILKAYKDYPKSLRVIPLRQRSVIKFLEGSFLFSGSYTTALRRSIELIQKNLSEGKSVLMLFPEREELFSVAEELYYHFGDKVIEISSRISPKRLYENWFRSQENAVVVVGSFKACFTPVKSIGGVLVFNETGNTKYIKNGVDIRRVAYLVAKSSGGTFGILTPMYTLESYYGVKRGMLSLDEETFKADVYTFSRKGEVLSEELFKTIEKKEREEFLFLVSKSGYSYLFCPRCDGLVECPECGTFLTFSKEKEVVFCSRKSSHYKSVDKSCPRCGGSAEEYGFGIEKAKETIEALFGKKENWDFSTSPDWKKRYRNVVILNADSILSVPSYRSFERFLLFVAHALRSAEESLFLQTGVLDGEELSIIQKKEFKKLLDEELERRRMEDLPPFVRIVLVESLEDIEDLIKNYITETFSKVFNSKEKVWQYLLKIRSREALKKLWELKKAEKNLRIVLDWK